MSLSFSAMSSDLDRLRGISSGFTYQNNQRSLSNRLCSMVGVSLQILFTGLYISLNYSIICDIIKPHTIVYNNILLTSVLYIIYGFLSLNTIFNFLAASAMSPGVTENFPTLQTAVYEHSNIVNVEICTKCDKLKPPRSHHCSVCDKCVFKMDHHCPWINNCVGHLNLRFFLLFLLYTDLLVCSTGLGYLNIETNSRFEGTKKGIIAEVGSIALLTIGIALSLFTMFNWALAIRGFTQIEYWMKNNPNTFTNQQLTFEHPTWRENLKEVFGTSNIIQILLPSFRLQPENGIIWKNSRVNVIASLQDLTTNVTPSIHLGQQQQKDEQVIEIQPTQQSHHYTHSSTLPSF